VDTDGPHGDQTGVLTATDGHPFWVPQLHRWVKATDLQPGQWLQTSAGLKWVSPALPGSTHDLMAAREHGIIDALTDRNVMTFADKGYQGAGGTVRTPFKRHHPRPPLSRNQKAVNRFHARIRALGERANATLKTWKILNRLHCCPQRASALLAAIFALQLVEEQRQSGRNDSLSKNGTRNR
jgi:hypothetical protein